MRSFLLRPLAALLTFAVSLSPFLLNLSVLLPRRDTGEMCLLYFPAALVDDLGRALAVWSQKHGKLILIDGERITYFKRVEWVRSSPDGALPDPVYTVGWHIRGLHYGPTSPQWSALFKVVSKKQCKESQLYSLIEELADPGSVERVTPQKLASAIKCLGKVKFEDIIGKVEFGEIRRRDAQR